MGVLSRRSPARPCSRAHTPARRPRPHARRRRAALVLLTVLGAQGSAHATLLHLPVTVSPAALLSPAATVLRAACDAGLQLALAGHPAAPQVDGVSTHFVLSTSASPTVTLITAAGSMLARCHQGFMDSRALLDARQNPSGTVWITVRGTTRTSVRDEVQGWHVSLSVQDAAGREVAHVEPTLVAAGRSELWTASCQDTACVWTGENRYGFDLGRLPAAVRTAVLGASSVSVDVDLPVPELMAGQP